MNRNKAHRNKASHRVTDVQDMSLYWSDALLPWIIAIGGSSLLLLSGLISFTNGIVIDYVTHLWFCVIVVFWFLALGKRFPVGMLKMEGLQGWFRVWAIVGGIILLLNLVSPSQLSHHGLVSLLALFLFQGVFVGLSEEFLFRGLIQTSLNAVLSRYWPQGAGLRWGTILASVLFGLSHSLNVFHQSVPATAMQVAYATAMGLVLGHYYDRTRNLWGAAILHNAVDLMSVLVPLLFFR